MARDGRGLRLSIFLNQGDLWHHRPVYHEIVARARRAGLARATVFRGIEGYGAGGVVHRTRPLALSPGLPLVVVILDSAARVRRFLPQLDELIGDGLVVLDEVELVGRTAAVPGAEPGTDGSDAHRYDAPEDEPTSPPRG